MQEERGRVRWASVAAYYAVACTVSWPFFWWRWAHPESWAAFRPPFPKHLLYMWGPGIGALVALAAFRRTHPRTITLAGGSPTRSVLFWTVPAAALLAAYLPEIARSGRWEVAPGLLAVGFVAVLGEELGWRGFLQDALRPLRRLPRYLLIGVAWELWHFTTRWGDRSPPSAVAGVAGMCVFTSILSWILGEATDRSRAVVVAVTLHAWVNLAFEAEEMLGAPPLRAWLVAAGSVAFWIWLLRTWPRRTGAVPLPPSPGDASPPAVDSAGRP